MIVKLKYTDGRSALSEADPTATELRHFGEDGLYHLFEPTDDTDDEGRIVYVGREPVEP
jgi:hypothetical protein